MTGRQLLSKLRPMLADEGLDAEVSLVDVLDDLATIGMDGAHGAYMNALMYRGRVNQILCDIARSDEDGHDLLMHADGNWEFASSTYSDEEVISMALDGFEVGKLAKVQRMCRTFGVAVPTRLPE